MPRKSMQALLTEGKTERLRPDAPYELNDEAAAEWRAITGSMSPEHFARCNQPLLVQLCRHIVNARRVAQMIEQLVAKENFSSSEYVKLIKAETVESEIMHRLARSMRLTQQSIYRGELAKVRPVIEAPWSHKDEQDDDED